MLSGSVAFATPAVVAIVPERLKLVGQTIVDDSDDPFETATARRETRHDTPTLAALRRRTDCDCPRTSIERSRSRSGELPRRTNERLCRAVGQETGADREESLLALWLALTPLVPVASATNELCRANRVVRVVRSHTPRLHRPLSMSRNLLTDLLTTW